MSAPAHAQQPESHRAHCHGLVSSTASETTQVSVGGNGDCSFEADDHPATDVLKVCPVGTVCDFDVVWMDDSAAIVGRVRKVSKLSTATSCSGTLRRDATGLTLSIPPEGCLRDLGLGGWQGPRRVSRRIALHHQWTNARLPGQWRVLSNHSRDFCTR
jgi:hypothetical protein